VRRHAFSLLPACVGGLVARLGGPQPDANGNDEFVYHPQMQATAAMFFPSSFPGGTPDAQRYFVCGSISIARTSLSFIDPFFRPKNVISRFSL
jgi:hypothetical protein